MPILAHLTEEASRAIGTAVLIVFLAAVTLIVAVVWGIVLLVRSIRRRRNGKPEP
jgi:tellurite resistance protein TehA-like permease